MQIIICRYNFFDKLDGLHGMHVHFGRPGVAADGEDVLGEVDHGVAGGDGVHVGHVTTKTCTEATSRTASDSNNVCAGQIPGEDWENGQRSAGKGSDRPDG